MADKTIQRLEPSTFRHCPELRSELIALVRDSYEKPEAPVDAALGHNEALYLNRNETGQLASFFFTAKPTLIVDGQPMPSLYMGLLATGPSAPGGAAWTLRTFIRDVQQQQKRIPVWGRTASPIILHLMHTLLSDVSPMPDGTYTEANLPFALAIRDYYDYDLTPGEHPFVLRRNAKYHYSAKETAGIEKFTQKRKCALLSDLALNETAGDRIFYCGYIDCGKKK